MGRKHTRMASLAGVMVLACLFIPPGGLADETPFVMRVNKLCGVDNYHAPNTLIDCQVQNARNVVFDEDASAKMREGFVTYLTLGPGASIRGMWPYRAADGTDWLLTLSSDTFSGYNGTSTSTVISGLNPNASMDCAQCLGDLYCTDRSTHVFHFDGSAVTYDSGAPKASQVECWRNRVVLADVSGEQSTVYLSGELNGTDWTTGSVSTAAVTWRVGGVNDAGNQVKCMKAGFADVLYLGTPNNSWVFLGNDQRDFQLSSLFSDVGCLDNGTVQEHLGELTWVSNKGVERFDRNVLAYPRVSEPIRGVTDGLTSSSAQEFSWVQTTQAHFEAGTHDQTSDTIAAGNVQLSTASMTDTLDADFGAGSTSNTSVINDRVYLSTNNTNIDNYSFESWSMSGPDNWSGEIYTANLVSGGCVGFDGTYAGYMYASGPSGDSLTFHILDADENELEWQTLMTNSGSDSCSTDAQTEEIDLSDYAGRWIKVRFKSNGASHAGTSDVFLCSGGTMSITFSGDNYAYDKFIIDNITYGRSTIYSGTFTSQAFDTAFASAAWTSSGATWTTNDHVISAETQSSSDGASWQTAVAWSTGSAPSSDIRRYLRYVVTLSTGGTTDGTALPYVDDATLSGRASTGTFISDAKDVSGNTTWGNFESNQTPDSGTISYYVRSAATEGGLASAAWVAQTPFTTVADTVNDWVQYRVDFVITDGAQDPAHHDGSVFWRTGTTSPIPSSVIYKDRYHLFYTTSSADDAYNNMAAVLDRNKVWTFFDGINAASTALYRNQLLVGDAQATGKIYRLYSGYNDDGSAIDAYVHLRDMANNDDEDAEQVWEKMYVTLGHETEATQDVDVDVAYTVDGYDEEYSLGSINLAENTGRIVAHVPFQLGGTNLNYGRWLSPRLSWSSLDAPVSLYGLRIYGKRQEVE